jgi:hypothetical protein
MRRLSFLVLPGSRDGLGGYGLTRRRRVSGAAGALLAACALWGLVGAAVWWLA